MDIEPGLEFYWLDGCCCCSAFVNVELAQAASALGGAVLVADGKRTAAQATAETYGGHFVSLLQLPDCEWTQLEVRGPGSELDGDYLLPAYEELLALLGDGAPPAARWDYSRPGLAAAWIATRLGDARALAYWGSDEWPGIATVAELRGGTLVEALSGDSLDVIARSHVSRQAMDLDDEDEDDDDERDENVCWRVRPGAGETRVETPLEEAADAFFRERGVRVYQEPIDDVIAAMADVAAGEAVDDLLAAAIAPPPAG